MQQDRTLSFLKTKNILQKILIFFISFSSITSSLIAEERLDSYKSKLNEKLSLYDEENVKAQAKAYQGYLVSLEELKDRVQKEGNLNATLEVLNEIKRFKKDPSPPKKTASLSSLATEQKLLYVTQKKIHTLAIKRKQSLFKQYDKALENLQKTLVREGKLEKAIEVKSERESTAKTVAKGAYSVALKPKPTVQKPIKKQPATTTQKSKANSLKITKSYIWLPASVQLPSEISLQFTFNQEGDFLSCYSTNKKKWGQGSDALSWMLSPNRNDFTFGTGLFKAFPPVKRGKKTKIIIGKKHTMRCIVTETSASYYVDGEWYATATYPKGTISPEGSFGFAVYKPVDIDVQNITIINHDRDSIRQNKTIKTDREIAEHLFSRSGTPLIKIAFNQQEKVISSRTQIPKDSFKITEIQLHKSPGPFTDEDLKIVANCSELRRLNLWGCNNKGISDTGVHHLTRLNKLESIYLRGAPLTDESAKYLASVKSMRSVNFGGKGISDKGFQYICSNKNIESLCMEGTLLTDKGLKEIAKLNKLKSLNISGSKNLTDLSLMHITAYKNLNTLHMGGTLATDEGFKKLARQLPNCKIHH